MTLGHWQRLATPHLAGVLERRPGVQVRGQHSNSLGADDQAHTLAALQNIGQYHAYENVFITALFCFAISS
jgi:hypothetical protein